MNWSMQSAFKSQNSHCVCKKKKKFLLFDLEQFTSIKTFSQQIQGCYEQDFLKTIVTYFIFIHTMKNTGHILY